VSDNVGFELYDITSIGQSTLLMLAGSIFGPGEAFTLSWSTTVNALEDTMASRGDALLLEKKTTSSTAHQMQAGSLETLFTSWPPEARRFASVSLSNRIIGSCF
jgi:uncharacterized protein (DUF927 family)